ncbi:MAG: carbohydrate kinase [SAR324 cluster bacterium]|uniref:Carbohydrate kinase n=1 Tax=SAR324 cluster bacterium TaxID=2024889 RepID=A0A7X9IK98_9DELT|nr:carbohydrate kinase [SAR324 cluster bacterium]
MENNLNIQQSVLAYGELLWDLLPTGKLLGGAPANFAYRLQNLGISVSLVSRVGEDALGNEAISILSKSGLSTELIQRDKRNPTGTVDVQIDANGNAKFSINPHVAYDEIEFCDEIADAAQSCAILCFGSLIQRAEKSRQTLMRILKNAKNACKIMDLNLRPNCYSKGVIENSLEHIDILKLNHEEALILSEMLALPFSSEAAFCKALLDRYKLLSCVITRAENGVFGMNRDGEEADLPGIKVKVLDTIGSGDAFTAGFVAMFLKNAPFAKCCEFGNHVGALVAGTKGGMTPI